MADTILGTLTIGQTPRPDVTPILDRYVPTSVSVFTAACSTACRATRLLARMPPKPERPCW